MPAGKQADPYQGWIAFAGVRTGIGAGQCQYTCKCGVEQMNATRAIAYQLAREHVARHGVVIETAPERPANLGVTRPRDSGTAPHPLRHLGLS